LQHENRTSILKLALRKFDQDQKLKGIIKELGIQEISIHGKIENIISSTPIIAIPIDDLPPDLTDWTNTIRNEARVWVISKYSLNGGSEILYSIPDEAIYTDGLGSDRGDYLPTGNLFHLLIKKGLLNDGDTLYLEYGPRGQGKLRFEGIARQDGIEIDGKVYSPSYAAVACIQKTGSQRQTANGWTMWRRQDGLFLNDLYHQALDMTKDQQ